MPFLKISHVLQQDRSDCLVACAAMMLASDDVHIDSRRIESLLGFKGESLPYSRLLRLNRAQVDLPVSLQQGTLQSLMAAIDSGTAPAIFVVTSELPYWDESVYHAVVVVGYTETEFLLHDPAFSYAPQIVPIGDLDLAWLEYDSHFAMIQRTHQ